MRATIEGKIIRELSCKRGVCKNGKDWERKEYLLQENDLYRKIIRFSMMSYDGPIAETLKEGDEVKLHVSVEAVENKGTWYNNVVAYALERSDGKYRSL